MLKCPHLFGRCAGEGILLMKKLIRLAAGVIAAILITTSGAGAQRAYASATVSAGFETAADPESPDYTPIDETEAKSCWSKTAKFADALDLEELATHATYVPVTTAAQIREELESEKRMTAAELQAKRELFAYIGSIGVVNVSRSLNIREAPDGDASIVGKVLQSSAVIIRNFAGDDFEWVYISSGSVCGWAVSKYVVMGEQADSLYEAMEPKVATTVCEATAYESASDTSNVAVKLDMGQSFVVLGYEGDYVKVQLTAASDGYIYNEYIAVTEGLFAGLKLIEEEKIQDAIDLLVETRRIMAEKKKAEAEAAAEAAKIAAAKKAEKAKQQSSSSSSSSSSSVGTTDEEGWTYLGKFRVTFYCTECNTPRNSRQTYSGKSATEWHTCAVKVSQIAMGTQVKVAGFGTWVAEDTGVGWNQIDLFVSPDECDGLYYRDVWVKK